MHRNWVACVDFGAAAALAVFQLKELQRGISRRVSEQSRRQEDLATTASIGSANKPTSCQPRNKSRIRKFEKFLHLPHLRRTIFAFSQHKIIWKGTNEIGR